MAAKPSSDRQLYEFGEFALDATARTLRRNGELVILPPLVLDTLVLLIESRGEVLTKREMLDAIWPETFVEEGNLTQNIYLLRRTLGKDENGKDWIETMPRRGYVFSGRVKKPDVALPDESPAPRKSTRRLFYWAVAIVLVSSFLAGGIYLFIRNGRSAEPVEAATADVALQKLTFSGDIEFPVIAPDGKSFAFSRNGRLFVQQVGSETPRQIELPEKYVAGFLQFTPDSRFIAFRSQLRFYLAGDAYKVPVAGGPPEPLAENVWGGIGCSPDGRSIAFVRDLPDENRHRLVVKDLTSQSEKILAELISPSRFIFIGSPAWSPDGTRIAIAANNQELQTRRVQLSIYDVASGSVEEFAPQRLRQFEQAVWKPDGKSINVIARENQKFFQVWELSYPEGRLRRITNDLNSYRGLSMSTDGRAMLAANFTTFSHIWTAAVDSLETDRQMTFGNLNRDGTIGIQWLPDGSIVYSSRVFGNVDIFRAGPRELDKLQLTREAGTGNANPELSPDGKTLYFTSNRTGPTQLWKMDAETGNDQTQITFGEKETNEFPQISPDGGTLYFVKKTGEQTGIWRRDLNTNAESPIVVDGAVVPETFLALSPDGALLATCSLTDKQDENADSQTFRIALIAVKGGEKPRYFNIPNSWITWSPTGGAFDYVEVKEGNSIVWRQALDGSPPTKLFELKGEYIARLQWSPDGRTLAISKGKRLNDAVLISRF